MRADVQAFYDPATSTFSYVVADPASGAAAIIDPVLDFDVRSGVLSTLSAARMLEHVHARGLHVEWILETHAHADHLSAAQWLSSRLDGAAMAADAGAAESGRARVPSRAKVGVGEGIVAVQSTFKTLLGLAQEFEPDGRQFDRLFAPEESCTLGALTVRAMATPGHTPDGMTWLIGDAAFIGDTLFMPDCGSARCDFPGGDALVLWESIERLLALPEQTRLFVCHDYPPAGRAPRCETTAAEQRAANVHVGPGATRDGFVAMRRARDATLPSPALLWPALQVNIRAGHLPQPEPDGRRFLRIPLSGALC